MNYINKISSLEEMSSAQVAINLCQDNGFKEIVLLLEKPTYGMFVTITSRHMALFNCNSQLEVFVSDPVKLSLWDNMKKDCRSLEDFTRSCYFNDAGKFKLWDAALETQCKRLMEGIPSILRQELQIWINRIALEYLSYSRRMEVLFSVSRYFLMRVLTWEDWTKAGHLDEKKLALRLLQDERLTVLQRYRIACVYCLHIHISRLWRSLTEEEKQFTSWNDGCGLSKETNDLVLLWSRHMYKEEEKVKCQANYPWTIAASKATFCGNRVSLTLCWENLKENIPQLIILDMALLSVQKWQSLPKRQSCGSYKEILVSDRFHIDTGTVETFNLPIYYSELMCFFLSQMDDEHQMTFFKTAFQSKYTNKILECFLDWPHYDNFLPTINKLWGIIPKDNYDQCLLKLVSKYSGKNENESCHYDYRNILDMLWEITPDEYKQNMFSHYESKEYLRLNVGNDILFRLSEKCPFQEKDESLFKHVFHDQPQEARRAMIYSDVGECICLELMQKGKWSFVNWFIKACLPGTEISSFKKQFIYSLSCLSFCVGGFKQNHERLVEDIIDWSLDLESEKEQFKCTLINRIDGSNSWQNLLCKGDLDEVDRIVNFLTSSEQKKKLYKWHFATYTCRILVAKYASDRQIDRILYWCLDSEEEIENFKKHIFEYKGVCPF